MADDKTIETKAPEAPVVSAESQTAADKLVSTLEKAHELHDSLHEKMNKKPEMAASSCKTYALHEVKATRKADSVGKNYNHEGYDYEKGVFVKNISITDAHAKAFNEQSHNTRQRYFEVKP